MGTTRSLTGPSASPNLPAITLTSTPSLGRTTGIISFRMSWYRGVIIFLTDGRLTP